MGNHKETNHLLLHSFILFSIFSLLLPCHCWTGFEPEDLQSETRVMELFRQWRTTHGKSYENVDVVSKRFENFKRNLKYIVEVNANQTGFTVGMNRFSDMSNEEFRAKYLGKVQLSLRRHTHSDSVLSCDAPRSLDWRKKGAVTPVKDQGVCGSSWVFSSTGAIEGINAINKGELISLSEQELVDCGGFNNGCDGNAFEWIINNGDGCPTTKVKNKVVNINGFVNVEESETSLLCATVNHPISVGIDGSSMEFQLYAGGIYDGPCSSNPDDINHAVLIVGFNSEDDNDYWIVKNSWGTTWGMDGNIYIRRNTNLPYGVCGINALAFYPSQSTLAASPSSPPPYDPPSQPSSPPPAPSPSPPPPPYDPPPQPSPPPPAPSPSYPTPSPPLPSPPPPPYNPPLPSPPLPTPSPPPPPPSPHRCGLLSYCLPGQTCCCLYEYFGFCFIQGCCDYINAVCCPNSDYCCPLEYPICDVNAGLCFKNYDDNLGIDLKKKKLANIALPWSAYEERKEITYQPIKCRRNGYAEV